MRLSGVCQYDHIHSDGTTEYLVHSMVDGNCTAICVDHEYWRRMEVTHWMPPLPKERL